MAEAVESMQSVFWRNGLEATSLSELTEALGLNKSSFYAAFDDKQSAYLASLDAYLAMTGKLVAEAMSKPTLEASLAAFFAADLDLFLARDHRGCFMISTAVPAASSDPAVARRVTAALGGIETAFRSRLKGAIESGEMPTSTDVDLKTDLLASLHTQVAVKSRAGVTRQELEAMINRTVSAVLSSDC